MLFACALPLNTICLSPSIQNIDNTNWMEGQHGLTSGRSGPAVSSSDDSLPALEKKANAFFGARGKRSVQTYQQLLNKLEKRSLGGQWAPQGQHKYNENFFAMRG